MNLPLEPRLEALLQRVQAQTPADTKVVRLGQTASSLQLDGLAALDVLRLCGSKGFAAQRLAKYEASVKDAGLIYGPPQARWTCRDGLQPLTDTKTMALVTVENAQRLVSFVLRRSLRSPAEIESTVQLFGIEQQQFESGFVAQAEKDTLHSIARAIPYPSVEQFRVGIYKVDMFFPDVKIAVECNEHGHAGYDVSAETQRRRFIAEQLGCRVVTYDPYAPNFHVMDVIREIVELLVCPEFHAWNAARVAGPWKPPEPTAPPEEPAKAAPYFYFE